MNYKSGVTICPKCSIGKLWIRRAWKHLPDGRTIGLEGFIICDACNKITDYKEEEWDLKLRKYQEPDT